MSTAYRVRPALPWDKLWSDLPEGFREEIVPPEEGRPNSGTTETQRCLTDGQSFLWAYRNEDGSDTSFERYGLQPALGDILDAIAEKYDVEIFSEHDDGFWDEEDYTVTVAGPERHDGEKPYTYVVRAVDEDEAAETVLGHHKAQEGTEDVELVEVKQGVPDAKCGFHWNDLRKEEGT